MAIVRSTKVFDGEVIAASGVATSAAVPLDGANGFSFIITSIVGTSPDVTFTYTLSPNGTDFVTPSVPAVIGTNASAADAYSFTPEHGREIKIVATNNNGTNGVTLTGYLEIQEI